MDLGLKDKVAVVTGGTSGIGAAVCRGLAQEGVHIALCSRHEKKARETAGEIGDAFSVRTTGAGVDVAKAEDIARFVKDIEERLGGADILVNNAGMGSEETILDSDDKDWQYFWDMQVMAAVRTARALVPSMRSRGGGVIINNASICGRQPLSHEPIYNTVKAALIMLSKCMSNEFMQYNIRVNCINPGLILTPAWEAGARSLSEAEGLSVQQYFDRIARAYTPIGRFASPEELAHFFVFLCSERASYCTGASYYVDGGWLKTTT